MINIMKYCVSECYLNISFVCVGEKGIDINVLLKSKIVINAQVSNRAAPLVFL